MPIEFKNGKVIVYCYVSWGNNCPGHKLGTGVCGNPYPPKYKKRKKNVTRKKDT